MKIFYSWQMDSPRKTNKDFISSALTLAAKKILGDPGFDSAERDPIELDQDTKGILGSPPIAEVIFAKIAQSDVLVADVTLVATGAAERKHINSNVAIELGYAYGKIGYEPILKIINTHYGTPDLLPFDLRSRRYPVTYCVGPDATTDEVRREKISLVEKLAPIIQTYLDAIKPPQLVLHVEAPSTFVKAAFWNPDEPLVPEAARHTKRSDVIWRGRSLIYVRLIPKLKVPRLEMQEVDRICRELQPIIYSNGWSHARNKWGMIAYDTSPDDELIGATQVMRDGEIWCIDGISGEIDFEKSNGRPIRLIPTESVQREYTLALEKLRAVFVGLHRDQRYIIEIGVSNASNIHLGIDMKYYNPFPGPFFEPEISLRIEVDAKVPTRRIMSDFWQKLFSEVNAAAPKSLLYTEVAED